MNEKKSGYLPVVRQMRLRFSMVIAVLVVIALADFIVSAYQINITDLTDDIIAEVEREKGLVLYSLNQADLLASGANEEQKTDARRELLITAQEIESNFDALTVERRSSFAKIEPTEAMLRLLYEPPVVLDSRVDSFVKEMRALSGTPSRDLNTANPHYVTLNSFVTQGALLNGLDELASHYKSDVEQKTENLKSLNIMNLLVLLMVIIMTKFFVFRPLMKTANESLEQMQQELEKRLMFEDRMKQNERRLKLIMQSIPEGVLVFTPAGTVEFANSSVTNLFLYPVTELKDKNIQMVIPSVTYNNEVMEFGRFLEILKEENIERLTSVSCEGLKKNGVTFRAQMSLEAQLRSDFTIYTAIIWDVSREVEEEKQKEIFVATLTHDLKTPLKAEYRIFDQMKNGAFGNLSADQGVVVDELIKSNRYIQNMVENLLTNYKFEAGRQTLTMTPTDLNKLVETVANTDLALLAEERRQNFSLDLDSEIYKVNLDTTEFRRVLYNLLQNAINYSPQKSTIYVSTRRHVNTVELTIRDQGGGMSEEQIQKLFQPFHSQAKKYKQIGTGLGLYVSKQIVDAHNGTIGVTSKLGEGTTFNIMLPL